MDSAARTPANMTDRPDNQVHEGVQSNAPKHERSSEDERPRQRSPDRSLNHPPAKPTQKGLVLTPTPCPHEALFARLSTDTQEQGAAEEDLLKTKIRELECLQTMQKQTEKEERLAISAQAASVKNEHKQGMAFIAARAKHESALSDLRTKEAALLASRNKTRHQGDMIMQKEREIEELRQRKIVDNTQRQRQAGLKGFKRFRR